MQKTPVMIASAAVSDRYRDRSWPASGATTAATMAQVAASGATISWRDEPKKA